MILKKLFELQNNCKTFKKTSDNPFFKSKYLDLTDILEYYIPVFNEHKILCIHQTIWDEVITKLIDIEDENLDCIQSEFRITNTDPQKRGSEITYWRRYNLWQLLNILAEDDDGNNASGVAEKEWLNIEDSQIEGLRTKRNNLNLTNSELLKKLQQTYKISKINQEKILWLK